MPTPNPLNRLLFLLACLGLLTGCTSGSSASEPRWEALPQIKAASFWGPENLWLVAELTGDLWHSADAGSTWEKAPGAAAGGRFYSVSFIGPQRGWAVGAGGGVWRTEDGGRGWTKVAELGAASGDAVFTGSPQMQFVDERHGWVIETLSVWRTHDGGYTWKKVLSILDPRVKGQPVSGAFKSPDAAVVCGTGGEIYVTNNGGESWDVKSVPDAGDFRYVDFLDERHGWLVGSGATRRGAVFLRTENGGESWRPLADAGDGASLHAVDFIDGDEGWAVGRALPEKSDRRLPREGLVLHTRDGGASWRRVQVGTGEPFFYRVFFPTKRQGWLCSRDNIYRTDDGGETWRLVFNLPEAGGRASE